MDLNYDNYLMENYGIQFEIIEMSRVAMQDIEECLKDIRNISEYNQLKVLSAMKDLGLSDFHLNDSTGYGYSDVGRDTIEDIYKMVFKAEDAIVRPQIISGTHAITLCLYGVLRPGDELLSVTGTPYDTLYDVINGTDCGSLKDFNIQYSEVALLANGEPDYETISKRLNDNTKMVMIQRSRGYNLRPALTIEEIRRLIGFIKYLNPNITCFVDNCYGEFVENKEPIEVGADLCAGSLIKNLGGGIAPAGGYVVGREKLISQCFSRLTVPGLDKSCGPSLQTNRMIAQGLFYAPLIVGEALKGGIFTSRLLELAGFDVFPKHDEKRSDIVTAAILGDRKRLINFCEGLQAVGPVDARVAPIPWAMPGYDNEIIMAAGCFIQGASIELSADAPLRPPYVIYIQGGLNFTHVKVGVMSALQRLVNHGYELKAGLSNRARCKTRTDKDS